MPNKTTNYLLLKPTLDENYDIEIQNNNMDIIDNEIKKVNTQLSDIQKEVLSNTLTKLTTDSTLTKLESVKDGFIDNMVIKGKTLQNLVIAGQNKNIVSQTQRVVTLRLQFSLKPNTVYTLYVEAATNYEKNLFASILENSVWGTRQELGVVQSKGLTKYSFTTNSSFNYNTLFVYDNAEGVGKSGTFSAMLLEGDWTNKEIPKYFEGIKSVGETEGNKISILTCGKNFVKSFSDLGGISFSTGLETNESGFVRTDFIKVTNSKDYVLSNGGVERSAIVYEYNSNKEFIKSTLGTSKIRMTQETMYIRLSGNPIDRDKFQLEEGATVTPYEPYKEDKTEILLKEPLMGLPNGVSDVIDVDKNEISRNIGKVIFDGSNDENWVIADELPNSFRFHFHIDQIPNALRIYNVSSINNIISNKFVNKSVASILINETEAIGITGSALSVRILKTKADTVQKFKALLKSWSDAGDPLTLYYHKEPVVEKLDVIEPLQTFENGYIQLDNAITPSVSLNYSTDLSSIIGKTTEVVDKLADRLATLEELVLSKIANP